MTTDELFSVPPSTDPLTLARKRLSDAQEAYDAAPADEDCLDIRRELQEAKWAVLRIEGKMLEQLKGKA